MGHWLGGVRLGRKRMSLAAKALRWKEDLVGWALWKEDQQGACGGSRGAGEGTVLGPIRKPELKGVFSGIQALHLCDGGKRTWDGGQEPVWTGGVWPRLERELSGPLDRIWD